MRFINKMFSGVVSTRQIGQDLVSIITDQEQQQLMDKIKRNSSSGEKDIFFALIVQYLFCFKFIMRRNNYGMKGTIISEIRYYFLLFLTNEYQTRYKLNFSQQEIVNNIKEKVENLPEINDGNTGNDLQEVFKLIAKELDIVDIRLLQNHVHKTATIIQDYFVELSFKNRRVKLTHHS